MLDSDIVEQVLRALLDRAASKPKQSGGAAERTLERRKWNLIGSKFRDLRRRLTMQ